MNPKEAKNTMSKENNNYQKCCNIIDKLLTQKDTETLANILKTVCAYNAQTAETVIKYNQKILEE